MITTNQKESGPLVLLSSVKKDRCPINLEDNHILDDHMKVQKVQNSKEALVAKNLMSLDEVMYSNINNKQRSSSINVNLVDRIKESDKNQIDISSLAPSYSKHSIDLQLSQYYYGEGSHTFEQLPPVETTSLEKTGVVENSISAEKLLTIRETETEIVQTESNFKKGNLKKRLPQISLGSKAPAYENSGQEDIFVNKHQSPISEIQSDNSSYSKKISLQIPKLSQANNGYDSIEALQNDEQNLYNFLILKEEDIQRKENQKPLKNESVEKDIFNEQIFLIKLIIFQNRFTLMFQSNCPIKSPIIPKIKRLANDHLSQLNSNPSPTSLLNIKSEHSNSSISTDQAFSIETMNLKQESLIKIQEQDNMDKKEIEREKFSISKDQIQYCLTDIKQVRNPKANAFRNKLNLQSHQASHFTEELPGFRQKSQSSIFELQFMKPPISIMEMQRNQQYNTTESPKLEHKIMDLEKEHMKEGLKQNISKELDQVDANQKRKFQRTLLRIKVEPQLINREENTETWDEIVSSDQAPTEAIIEPKPRQGSCNFEDMYSIINERPLGEGTSGCVYQCVKQNSEDDQIYAVKVMRNVDEEMSKSIFQTFGIQYRLQHDSISRVYEVYYNEDSQTVHFVMEYIPFRPLDSLIKDKKRVIKESDSSSIIQKLLKAVCYMEQRGVCHRDLKPENILISEDLSQLKIIDFGISKSFVKSQRVQHITQYFKHKMYTPTGTPSYKAPEIIQGAGYTQLVDMWAIGVISYQLICKGKHPFKCNSQVEQDKKILSQSYDQQEESWVKSSTNAKSFIKQLLRVNRYPAFEALKHPWIEQRKIDIASHDDNNTNSLKQDKKQSNDTMTISVPVLFQAKQFHSFNIAATNSEQALRSINQNDSSANQQNKYGNQSGKINEQITEGQDGTNSNKKESNENYLQKGESVKQSNFGQSAAKVIKKHSIQGFASTQDVVHIVIRQKLSESKEKMRQFFQKANLIIKNLEEEQLQLQQKNLTPGKTLKRTQSAEKKTLSPKNQAPAFPLLGLEGLPLLSSGGVASSFCHTPSQFANSPSITGNNSDEFSYTPQAAAMQVSTHQSLFSKEAQNSQGSNKNGSSLVINSNNVLEQITSQNMQSSQDLNNMKISSFAHRKDSQQAQSSLKTNIVQKKICRRNSTEQTNSMEKSIIFTKEVIGELQETFGNNQNQIDNFPHKLKVAQKNKLFAEPHDSKNIPSKTEMKTSKFYPQQNNEQKSQKKAFQDLKQKLLNDKSGEEFENEQEKWKLIAENMEIKSESSLDGKNDSSCSDSDASSSSKSIHSNSHLNQSGDDKTQSFDIDRFLIKNSLNSQEFQNASTPFQQNNNNKETDSDLIRFKELTNAQEKEIELSSNKAINNNENSSQIEQKNPIKLQQCIFQTIPYTNYMNSSKDNVIHKSLLDMQINKDDNQQSVFVMNTSSNSSKENSNSNNNLNNQVNQNSDQNGNSLSSLNQSPRQFHNHLLHQHHNNNNQVNPPKRNSHKQNQNQGTPLQPSISPMIISNSNINKNQSISSNCSSCGLPIQVITNEMKSSESLNEERLFKNKLGSIAKKESNEMSFSDSLADQNLSFVEMNYSKLMNSFCPNSEDPIQANLSVKKNNFQLSINVSQTSSLNANNLSLNGSSILRSNLGQQQMNYGIADGIISGNKDKINQVKLKQKSEQNSICSCNSQSRKGQLEISSHSLCNEIPVNVSRIITQKQFLDTSALLNSSSEATPSKQNLPADSEFNSNSDNSNNTNKNSIPTLESHPLSQGSSSSRCSSPQKHKHLESQFGFINQITKEENSPSESEEETKKQQQFCSSKNLPQIQIGERKQKQSSKSPQSKSPSAGMRHMAIRTFHNNNFPITNYSTIIEESGEAGLSSIAGSKQISEYDGTIISSVLRLNQSKSLTQFNQSVMDVSPLPSQGSHNLNCHQNISPLGFAHLFHGDESTGTPRNIDDKQQLDHKQGSSSVRVQSTSKNSYRVPSVKLVNKDASLILQHTQQQLDDFFGTMQKSSFFDEENSSPTQEQLIQKRKSISISNSSQKLEQTILSSLESAQQKIIEIHEQPPLLKYRKSSLKNQQKESLMENVNKMKKKDDEDSQIQIKKQQV